MTNYQKLYDSLIWSLQQRGVLVNPRLIEAFRRYPRYYFLPPDAVSKVYIDAPIPIAEGQTASQPYTIAFMLELLNPTPGDIVFELGYGSGWQTALLSYLVGDQGLVIAAEARPSLCEFGKKNIERFRLKNVILACADAISFAKRFQRKCAEEIGTQKADEYSLLRWLAEHNILYAMGHELDTDQPGAVTGVTTGGPNSHKADKLLCAAVTKVGRLGYNRIISGAALSDSAIRKLQFVLAPDGVMVVPTQRNSLLNIKNKGDKFIADEYPGFVFVKAIENQGIEGG